MTLVATCGARCMVHGAPRALSGQGRLRRARRMTVCGVGWGWVGPAAAAGAGRCAPPQQALYRAATQITGPS